MKPVTCIVVNILNYLHSMSPLGSQKNGLVIKIQTEANKNTNISTLLKVFIQATCIIQ